MINLKRKTKIIIVYLFTLSGIIIWIGAIFLGPYLKSKGSNVNTLIYAVFSHVCHQIPERCFFIFGYPLTVCARCLGIYTGFFAGATLYPFIKGFSNLSLPKTKNFILLSIPISIDTLGNLFYVWSTSDLLRFITGFIWGIILPFYFIMGLSDWATSKRNIQEKDYDQEFLEISIKKQIE